jgi:hypothetical protein
MRALLIVALLALGVACDTYGEVLKTDTIEAYEVWLKENPTHSKTFEANIRLEELYLQRARTSGKLEDWDAYLKRWPEGRHRDAARTEREEHLFTWAKDEATSEAWERYLGEYTEGFAAHRNAAKAGLEASTYARQMTFGEVKTRQVNLAEDPTGPMDGTAFTVEVQNNGDKTLEAMWLRIHYLGADGASLGSREWPLVAPYVEYPVPVPDEQTVPMKPGEVRTWEWWTGDLPEGFSGKAKVVPVRLRYAAGG